MWADGNHVRHEEQAGYRENYSTVDQIFTLRLLAYTYICKRKGQCLKQYHIYYYYS